MNVKRYQGGGITGGPNVESLLNLLANYDQDTSIGDFLKLLMAHEEDMSSDSLDIDPKHAEEYKTILKEKMPEIASTLMSAPAYSMGAITGDAAADVLSGQTYGAAPGLRKPSGTGSPFVSFPHEAESKIDEFNRALQQSLATGEGGSIMQNLPPETLEEIIRQVGMQRPR
jgi:hypothetical protein